MIDKAFLKPLFRASVVNCRATFNKKIKMTPLPLFASTRRATFHYLLICFRQYNCFIMGKLRLDKIHHRNPDECKNYDAPLCASDECCLTISRDGDETKFDETKLRKSRSTSITTTASTNTSTSTTSFTRTAEPEEKEDEETVKEILVIGAGPHALTLLLRLLEPDPDFLSEKERHRTAESTKRMRPLTEVKRHVKDISRGPRATLKKRKRKPGKNEVPPPLPLEDVLNSVQIVDSKGDWLTGWKQNFAVLGIKTLRSLMNAHSDPYDHRALEYWAEINGRGYELVTLKNLDQRDNYFRGPYQVPTSKVFHDFHDALIRAYGIDNTVQKANVVSIHPMQSNLKSDEPIFEVKISNGLTSKGTTTVKTKRIVCAMGPNFSKKSETLWETSLRSKLGTSYKRPSENIIQAGDIVPWLQRQETTEQQKCNIKTKRLLIVGGGITSAQLALIALKSPWCKCATLIQRSKSLQRHFDIENSWMGPLRGKLLDDFFSLDVCDRAHRLRDARKGGSIPPELLEELNRQEERNPNLTCMEEVQISDVDWAENEFDVTFDDNSTGQYDLIWLATGGQNHIDRYPALDILKKTLPIKVINGLPVLDQDLSWSSQCGEGEIGECDEPKWKQIARKRIWCLGALSGLQLGPDALNIIGARHGAVKVANAIRHDMATGNNGVN